ncbi:MAG: hypothetical protein PHQ11_13765 [Paludibacter sp.]|nr:hypothetical protein [Paludibacter sp.]MDD4429140.1 hypothetical protein [Paludibacter sp.]
MYQKKYSIKIGRKVYSLCFTGEKWVVQGVLGIGTAFMLILIIGISATTYLQSTSFDRINNARPEKNIINNFLMSSPELQTEFGSPLEIMPENLSLRFWTDRKDGVESYFIEGSKKGGMVVVHWISSMKPEECFVVNELGMVLESGEVKPLLKIKKIY